MRKQGSNRWAWLGGSLTLLLAGCTSEKPVPVPSGASLVSSPCASLTYAGFPVSAVPAKSRSFACHDGYALDFSSLTHTALWVVERLDRDRLSQGNARRIDDFRIDPALPPSFRNQASNYEGSLYDRGHLAPVEDFRDSRVRTNQSFYYSNTVAQDPTNNRGIWALLEMNVRGWAMQHGQLYVITGPLFSGGQPKEWIGQVVIDRRFGRVSNPSQEEIQRQKMAVPTHLYKVVVDAQTGQAIAFVLPNAPQSADPKTLAGFAVSVRTLESVSGLVFFPDLPASRVALVKDKVDPAAWPLLAVPPDPALQAAPPSL